MNNTEYVYVDTSAFYALIDRSDKYHKSAKEIWEELLNYNVSLLTSNYIVSETMTLLQYRISYEAAKCWYKDILSVLDVYWVNKSDHQRAYVLWRSLGQRKNTMIDCLSFVTMHKHNTEKAFSFKRQFGDQGFEVLTG
ncbi:MAG: PIN domain-containing protein [Desulfobacterales bacterium]|nr:PIN domain-containing protein [Desulfobacterales bacterium]